MRTSLALGATVGALMLLATTGGAEACSIRGTFCGYPAWAANAFEGPKGFRGNPAILTDRSGGEGKTSVARTATRRKR